eukprot:scaffold221_cov122-Isochrysis_galbana.AAC.8
MARYARIELENLLVVAVQTCGALRGRRPCAPALQLQLQLLVTYTLFFADARETAGGPSLGSAPGCSGLAGGGLSLAVHAIHVALVDRRHAAAGVDAREAQAPRPARNGLVRPIGSPRVERVHRGQLLRWVTHVRNAPEQPDALAELLHTRRREEVEGDRPVPPVGRRALEPGHRLATGGCCRVQFVVHREERLEIGAVHQPYLVVPPAVAAARFAVHRAACEARQVERGEPVRILPHPQNPSVPDSRRHLGSLHRRQRHLLLSEARGHGAPHGLRVAPQPAGEAGGRQLDRRPGHHRDGGDACPGGGGSRREVRGELCVAERGEVR